MNTYKSIINNEFDYSNSLPTIEHITYLVEYMSNVYDDFIKLIKEDEEKNEKFKREYQVWNYRKCYGDCFQVYIGQKNYSGIYCKDFESFKSAVENGYLNNVERLTIELCLYFERGTNNEFDKHENDFKISFKPYDIVFERKSNHDDNNMNQIENNINMILKKFSMTNTIFCTK